MMTENVKRYYVLKDGKTEGPLSVQFIARQLIRQELKYDVLICREGASSWVCAKDDPFIQKAITRLKGEDSTAKDHSEPENNEKELISPAFKSKYGFTLLANSNLHTGFQVVAYFSYIASVIFLIIFLGSKEKSFTGGYVLAYLAMSISILISGMILHFCCHILIYIKSCSKLKLENMKKGGQ